MAIVTGAARGIGAASAARLAAEGANVVLFDLPDSDLEPVTQAVAEAGGKALAVAGDVRQPANLERCVAAATERFGGVDILFANAGIEGSADAWFEPETPVEVFDQVIDVNLRGVFYALRAVVPAMRERGAGAIVATSSTAGLGGSRRGLAYPASKHGVIGIVRSAALQLARFGIRVNAICPGPTETPMMRAIERQLSPDDPQAVHDARTRSVPLRRYAEPSEIAALVAFLCSDDASYITGGAYPVDGGSGA